PSPTSAPTSQQGCGDSVAAGESLSAIAYRYHESVAAIRWSNTSLLSTATGATAGQIVIPPVHGIVVKTKASDTVEGLGAKYQVDPQVIIDFNRLRSTQLTPGMTLVLPGGVGGAFPPPPAIYQILHGGSPSNYMVHVVG